MAAKLFIILSVVAAAAAAVLPAALEAAPAHYEYAYFVHDEHSGDAKQQREARQGDSVQGSYSLLQPDGLTRVVEYTADKEHGFVANVRYEGNPAPAPAKVYDPAPVIYAAPKVAYAPVAKIAYAAPKIAYAAPKIAYAAPKVVYSAPKVVYSAPKLAYAAPVAKVAYAENLGHVSFSSPVISYHH